MAQSGNRYVSTSAESLTYTGAMVVVDETPDVTTEIGHDSSFDQIK